MGNIQTIGIIDTVLTLSYSCKLLSLDVGALVAGTKYRGEFEDRMKTVLKEIEDSTQMIVLFIDEIHLLMGAGSAGEGGMVGLNFP